MGTPDYISPEQAMESHTVDIRADLYSLGCAFYYLLTGKAPFQGGALMEKLLKHRLEEPRPVEQLRPDTPPGVARVVRKLMAKKPEDRYQTPAEAAAALEGAAASGSAPAGEDDGTMAKGSRTEPAAESSGDTFASPFASLDREAIKGGNTPLPHPTAEGVRWLLYLMAGGGLFLIGMAVLVSLFWKDLVRTTPAAREDPRVVGNPPSEAKGDAARLQTIAAMPAEEQVDAVVAWLKERNPDFDGRYTHKVEGGVVTELSFITDNITDIGPVRALIGLRTLKFNGTATRRGKIADLTPLKDMRLTELDCRYTQVSDLSPLKDMKLTVLFCGPQVTDLSPLKDMRLVELRCTGKVSDLSPLKDMKLTKLICDRTREVSDLSPLKDMKLTFLVFNGTKVSDLSPLKDMKLTHLDCGGTLVGDLSPLKDMKLTLLRCGGTKVSDLSPLKGMPLKVLSCDFKPERDAEILRSLKTLKSINKKPAKEFWKEVDAKKLDKKPCGGRSPEGNLEGFGRLP